jgi:hypothetical protein
LKSGQMILHSYVHYSIIHKSQSKETT